MTWLGKRKTHQVESWLDRAMLNKEWRAEFPVSQVHSLEMIESDHRPAVIKIQRTNDMRKRLFRYDPRMGKVPDFAEVINQGWNDNYNGSVSTGVERIKSCRKEIAWWRRNNNTNSAKQIKLLTVSIDHAQTDGVTTTEQFRSMRVELLQAYREEEKYWKVKSRNQRLNEGDLNTKFFHASTKNRNARNHISKIKGPDGEVIYGNRGIASEATQFFGELFTSSNTQNLSEVLRCTQTVVTDEMNAELICYVSDAEIRQTIFAIGPTHAPGPDGLNASFYQQYWEIVGPAIIAEVKMFFETGVFPQ